MIYVTILNVWELSIFRFGTFMKERENYFFHEPISMPSPYKLIMKAKPWGKEHVMSCDALHAYDWPDTILTNGTLGEWGIEDNPSTLTNAQAQP
jgi:hypothetical protein